MDIAGYFEQEIAEHVLLLARTREVVREGFARLVDMCLDAIQGGRKILLFGNGGSAADAQHLAAELVVRYRFNRPAIRAIALTTDTSILTAIGNDLSFEHLFARQIEALCCRGDVVIGISTSGNSENVLRALRAARALGGVTVGMTGGSGGDIVNCVDVALVVPSDSTARIQEMHILLGHMLCGLLEQEAVFSVVSRQAGDVSLAGGA